MTRFLSGIGSGLQLIWGGGEIEVFSEDEFVVECKNRHRKIPLLNHRGEKMCDEEYSLTVKGNTALLDYGGKFKAANSRKERDLYIGKTRIDFTDKERLYVKSVLWQDEGDNKFRDCGVKYSWTSLGERKHTKFRIPRNGNKHQKSQFTTVRPGRERFRRDMIEAFKGQCCLSGCSVTQSLEAAHIHPYQNEESDHPQNGLLMRADLHRLFDAYLFSIDPKTLTVQLAQSLSACTDYDWLQGKKLSLPRNQNYQPASGALKWRWKEFRKQAVASPHGE